MMKFLRNRLNERKTFNELNRLSNRELADIGINRSEIHSIARQSTNDIF